MRIMGYCTECHRFKWVRVKRWFHTRNVPSGVCAECEDKRR